MKPDFALVQGWWYPAVLSVVLMLILIFMPKKIGWRSVTLIFVFVGYIVWMVDMTIAGPFDIFDIGSPKTEGLPEILLYGVIPSCLSAIYTNFYKPERKWVLVIIFVLLSFILEWLAVRIDLMKLKHWNTWWSLPIYFGAYAFFLPWLLKMVRSKGRSRTKR